MSSHDIIVNTLAASLSSVVIANDASLVPIIWLCTWNVMLEHRALCHRSQAALWLVMLQETIITIRSQPTPRSVIATSSRWTPTIPLARQMQAFHPTSWYHSLRPARLSYHLLARWSRLVWPTTCPMKTTADTDCSYLFYNFIQLSLVMNSLSSHTLGNSTALNVPHRHTFSGPLASVCATSMSQFSFLPGAIIQYLGDHTHTNTLSVLTTLSSTSHCSN